MQAIDILQVINTAGVIGVLVLICVAFYKGKVLPASQVEKLLKAMEGQAALLAETITVKIENGMERAIEVGTARAVKTALELLKRAEPDEKREAMEAKRGVPGNP